MKTAALKESIRNCATQQEEFRLELAKAHEKYISIYDRAFFFRNYRIRIASNNVAYWEHNLQRNKNRMKFYMNELNSKR